MIQALAALLPDRSIVLPLRGKTVDAIAFRVLHQSQAR